MVISVIFSFPVFLKGIAIVMSIATTFVKDAWAGGTLIRSVFNLPVVLMELIYVTFFLIEPIFAFCIALLMRVEDPWRIAAIIWAWTLFVIFFLFFLAVLYQELKACFDLIQVHERHGGGWLSVINNAFLFSQKARFSGVEKHSYLVNGEDETPPGGFSSSPDYTPVKVKTSWIGLMTKCCTGPTGFYEKIVPPRRLYTSEEIQDTLPFMTKDNWTLESVCCKGKNKKRAIFAATGPSALRSSQTLTAVICSFIGGIMMLLVVVGCVMWVNVGSMAVWLVVPAVILSIMCCLLPMATSSYRTYKKHSEVRRDVKKSLAKDIDGGEEGNTKERLSHRPSFVSQNKGGTLFQVVETLRITRPKTWFRYALGIVEFGLFFVWPLATILVSQNTRVGIVFLCFGIFTFLLKFFDVGSVLEEVGSLGDVDFDGDEDEQSPEELQARFRLSSLVGEIQHSSTKGLWMGIFGTELVVVLLMVLVANAQTNTKPAANPPVNLVNDFFYPSNYSSIAYPTCQLTEDLNTPGARETALEDYVFIDLISYENHTSAEKGLNQWFGPGVLVDNEALVDQWRAENGYTDNPTYFKLFTIPSLPNVAIVGIRGSTVSLKEQ